MNVHAFTYYDPVPAITPSDETQLILLWMDNWSKAGFVPVVLNQWHARQHPAFSQYSAAVAQLPSINPPGYDLACYYRWLAVANAMNEGEIGLMLDYDVFCYSSPLLGFDFAGQSSEKLYILDPSGVPGAVLGTAAQFSAQAQRFASYKPTAADSIDGTPHVSDMTILQTMRDQVNIVDAVREYSDPGWEAAPLVHYSNQKTSNVRPRWRHIPNLRPLNL